MRSLDPSGILVAFEGSSLLGLLVTFRELHKVLYVDSLLTTSDAPKRTSYLLLRALREHARKEGFTHIMGVTNNKTLKNLAIKHGGEALPVKYRLILPVEKEHARTIHDAKS